MPPPIWGWGWSELVSTLCIYRVTVMACSDISGSPVDEQTFIQVCMQCYWQLVMVLVMVLLTADVLCQFPNSKRKWKLTEHSWSMVCIIGACMSRECVLLWQWAGSMCYHSNEVYLSVLTPVVEEVYGIPWGLGFTPAVEEVCGIPWGLQLTKYSFDCMYVYYKATYPLRTATDQI